MTNSQTIIKVFTVEEMVAAEKAADAAGVSYDQMMETAGQSVAEAIRRRYPVSDRPILILVGPGNNGGDGLVAGRHLAQLGAEVTFYLYRARAAQEDANYALIRERGWPVLLAAEDEGYRELQQLVRQAEIVIDALLGTGVDRPIGGELADLMEAVQAALAERKEASGGDSGWLTTITAVEPSISPRPEPVIVAVDCPSGLNTDSGELDPLALPATLTVTFAGPKRGHFIFPGAGAVGELVVADIGISPQLSEVSSVPVVLATAALAQELLPARPASGHKGTFGKVLIVAGSAHYWGAPLLCGSGAYRTGSGLVAVAVPQKLRPVVAGRLPEATYPPVPDETEWSVAGAEFLLERLDGYDALLFGPGLGEAQAFVERLLEERSLPPLIVDADGLNSLARMADWPERLPANTVLTPHPGEMARLVGVPLTELAERERVAVAREKAAEWQQVVLLKGAHTVVAAPDGRCALLPFATPALSTAGSGDVLSGVIVSLLGQGLSSYEAAVLGGYLHGAAGHLAGEQMGQAGLLAGEIADWLPEVRRQLAS